MPQTPDPDDLTIRQIGAALRMRAMTPAELQAAQDRAFNLVTAAVFAFCAFPGPQEMDRVKAVMWAYQVAWMEGRERPKPPEAKPLETGDDVVLDGQHCGKISHFGMGQHGPVAFVTGQPSPVLVTRLTRWVRPTP